MGSLFWFTSKAVAFKTVEKPDVAFIGFPPIEFAYEAAEWMKKKKTTFYVRCKRSMA